MDLKNLIEVVCKSAKWDWSMVHFRRKGQPVFPFNAIYQRDVRISLRFFAVIDNEGFVPMMEEADWGVPGWKKRDLCCEVHYNGKPVFEVHYMYVYDGEVSASLPTSDDGSTNMPIRRNLMRFVRLLDSFNLAHREVTFDDVLSRAGFFVGDGSDRGRSPI